MNISRKKINVLKKFGLIILTVLLVGGGSFFQQRVLKVNASIQVLLTSGTAIAFGDVFPGENLSETYTVKLDQSTNSATYVTATSTITGLLDLCPYLNIHSIDPPAEHDTLAASTLTRGAGDVLDNWQVQLSVPGIKGQLSQDHNGGIIIQGGDFGCKITVTTASVPGKIIICKKSVGGAGTFSYTGDLGPFNIQTALSSQGNQGTDNGNNQDPCGASQDPCSGGSLNTTTGSNSGITDTTKCITNTTVTNTNGATVTNIVSSNSNSGGVVIGSGSGDINNTSVVTGNSGSTVSVGTSVNYINSTVNTGSGNNTGSGSKIFDNLQPGTYNVTESSGTDWTLTSLVCKDQSNNTVTSQNTANITLDSNETVTCTFINTLKNKGKIVIQKNALGGEGSFNFSGTLGAFSLQTSGGTGSKTFDNLSAGSYKVTESAASGWKFYSLVCTDPSHDTIINDSNANIKLANGETVTCVFTNKKKSKIIIHKKTGGDDDSCDFSGDLGHFALSVHGGSGSQTFDNLDSGTYNISENAKGNWAPSSVICTGGSANVTGSSAKINLGDGQTVDCTFSDSKKK
jgi:hypothetical protein